MIRHALVSMATISLLACTATTRTQTLAHRPADITLPPGSAVALDVQASCARVVRGPETRTVVDRQQTEILGVRVEARSAREARVEDAHACDAGAFHARLVGPVRSRATVAVTGAGHRLSKSEGDGQAVRLTLAAREVRDLELVGQRQDTKRDKACQKLCGRPVCDRYVIKGLLEIDARIEGPEFAGHPQGRRQRLTINALHGGDGDGEIERLACRRTDVEREWKDRRRYMWPAAYRRAVQALERDLVVRAFSKYAERYAVPLFDRGIDAPENDRGLEHAAVSRWTAALGAFRAASSSLAPDVDAEVRARVLHNVAASAMMLGDLETAHEAVRSALALATDADMQALKAEIERRQRDARRAAATQARKAETREAETRTTAR